MPSNQKGIGRPGRRILAHPANEIRATVPILRGRGRTVDLSILAGSFVLGVCGAIVLITASLRGHHQPRRLIGVAAYTLSLLAMLGCSLLYRSATESGRRQFLRRLDHSAIFAMIAGSATPFALMRDSVVGDASAAVLWAVAALGIAVKTYLPIGTIRRSAIWYLGLGWGALFAVGPTLSSQTAILLATGGAFYSFGVPFLLGWRRPYRVAIWHIFVLAGAACHYAAILCRVVLT
jgi:hemolysin III